MNLDREWRDFTHAARERTGVNLAGYKPEQTQRRIRWLMQRSGARQLSDYLSLLVREPSRLHELRTSMAVHVSEFFRSPEQFRKLAQDVLPKLLAQRPALRVWSAGCSYGAEPYSLALLLDQLAPREKHFILATDMDGQALARASAADSFSERDVRNVPLELRGYFRNMNGKFALDRVIASRVTFRQHDVLTDGPEQDFDLVLCRNVMMYFTDDAKDRLFTLLYRALRPGGYLFVGGAEVVNQLSAAGFTQELVGFYRTHQDGGSGMQFRAQGSGLRAPEAG